MFAGIAAGAQPSGRQGPRARSEMSLTAKGGSPPGRDCTLSGRPWPCADAFRAARAVNAPRADR
jgi:hypothetical protein